MPEMSQRIQFHLFFCSVNKDVMNESLKTGFLSQFQLLFIFDNAPSHRKKADDALNVHKMNLRPGGKFRQMRDTQYINSAGILCTQQFTETVWIEQLPKRSKHKPREFSFQPMDG